MAEFFIDTNVLLYAVSTTPSEQNKAAIARSILQTADWGWSAQVAAEFVRASTSKKQPAPLTLKQAGGFVQTWCAFPMHATDEKTVMDAIDIADRFQISYFDAQIVAAAKRMNCKTIYTEDLSSGQEYGGVKAINPFV